MMRLFRRGQHQAHQEPTQPLYADHKVLGLTLSFRAKLALVLIGAAVVLLIAGLLSLEALINARHDQTRKLACLLVSRIKPGNAQADQIRTEWNCPPYVAPPPSSSPTALPSSASLPPAAAGTGPTATPSSALPGVQSPPHTSSSPRTDRPSATATATRTVSAPPATRTVSAPPVTVTTHATVTAPPPPPVTVSPSGLCAVSPLLCGLLGG